MALGISLYVLLYLQRSYLIFLYFLSYQYLFFTIPSIILIVLQGFSVLSTSVKLLLLYSMSQISSYITFVNILMFALVSKI